MEGFDFRQVAALFPGGVAAEHFLEGYFLTCAHVDGFVHFAETPFAEKA